MQSVIYNQQHITNTGLILVVYNDLTKLNFPYSGGLMQLEASDEYRKLPEVFN